MAAFQCIAWIPLASTAPVISISYHASVIKREIIFRNAASIQYRICCPLKLAYFSDRSSVKNTMINGSSKYINIAWVEEGCVGSWLCILINAKGTLR